MKPAARFWKPYRFFEGLTRLNVFARFAIVHLLGIGLLVTILSYEFGGIVRREMLELEGRVVAAQVQAITEHAFATREQFEASAQEAGSARFASLAGDLLRIPDAFRVKVWDPESRILYSDEPKLIGRSFPHNEELAEALEGELEIEIGLSKDEHLYELDHAPEHRMLEIYVPLVQATGGRPYGVVEIYIYSPLFFVHMDEALRHLWLISGIGGGGIFIVLGGIFWSAWRKERRLTRELDNSRQLNEDIVGHLETGIVVLDSRLRVLSWNKEMERICGDCLRRERILGCDFSEVFPQGPDDTFLSRLEEVLRTGAAYTCYAQPCPICQTGSRKIVNIKLVPIVDDAGKPAMVLMTIEDLTELRKLEAQVIHSEKLATIGEMYAGLTHEINNPLGIILSKVKTLLAEGPAEGYPPSLMQDLQQIDRHSTRIAQTLRNLLTFARKATFERRNVDLNHLITETMGLVQKPFTKSNVHLEYSLEPDLPPVQGDPNLLQQVLMNLFSNARDAMPTGGRIWVRTRRGTGGEDGVLVEVEDEGTGIAAENLDKVFHPFFTTKEAGKGTGLGLSVSYGIVHAHGGDLRAEPRQGPGALFKMVLPAAGQRS